MTDRLNKLRSIAEFTVNLPIEVVCGVGAAALREIDILLGGDAPRITPPVTPAHLEIISTDEERHE